LDKAILSIIALDIPDVSAKKTICLLSALKEVRLKNKSIPAKKTLFVFIVAYYIKSLQYELILNAIVFFLKLFFRAIN
jgi:hypothetical protein